MYVLFFYTMFQSDWRVIINWSASSPLGLASANRKAWESKATVLSAKSNVEKLETKQHNLHSLSLN